MELQELEDRLRKETEHLSANVQQCNVIIEGVFNNGNTTIRQVIKQKGPNFTNQLDKLHAAKIELQLLEQEMAQQQQEIEAVLREDKINSVTEHKQLLITDVKDKPFELDVLDKQIQDELDAIYKEDEEMGIQQQADNLKEQ